jgi:hypothetical protein
MGLSLAKTPSDGISGMEFLEIDSLDGFWRGAKEARQLAYSREFSMYSSRSALL